MPKVYSFESLVNKYLNPSTRVGTFVTINMLGDIHPHRNLAKCKKNVTLIKLLLLYRLEYILDDPTPPV